MSSVRGGRDQPRRSRAHGAAGPRLPVTRARPAREGSPRTPDSPALPRPSPSAPKPLVERGSSFFEGTRQSIPRPMAARTPRLHASCGRDRGRLNASGNPPPRGRLRGSFPGVRYEKESCHSVDCRRGAPSRRCPTLHGRDLGGQRRSRSDGDLGSKRHRHCRLPDPAPVRRAEDQELSHHLRPQLPSGPPLQGLLHPVRSRLPQPPLSLIRGGPTRSPCQFWLSPP